MSVAGKNPLKVLHEYGQSVWLDYMRRSFITSGDLQRLIREDGLQGVTSNPAIFEKAIAGSADYQDLLAAAESQRLDAGALYEKIAVRDIQDAADLLRPVYEQTQRRDGYVSLEVSPLLAHNTQGTIAEARRLWTAVGRDNLMVKVPATPEGIPAIKRLIHEGINVNVTLLFSQAVYEQVATAYIAGLEERAAQGGDVSHVASVASFFISRIDTAVDDVITAKLKTTSGAQPQALLRSLLGKVAIANARMTYQGYQDLFRSPRWQALTHKGAQTQRLLWASTSTKNPNYRDVMYVEELIGPDTVNTLPPATFDAFRDHGRPRASLTENLAEAADTMKRLSQVGISMQDITDSLLEDGVRQFAEAFDKVLQATTRKEKASIQQALA
jgi:transaldolase/glucose-6-phosphate isomerase